MTALTNGLGAVPEAYANAPRIITEIGWLTEHAATRPFGQEPHREFWLRKAAVLDRIALGEEDAFAPAVAADAVAADAALQLIEHDVAHNGLSRRGAELATGDDHRAYVRQEYQDWNRAQRL